jgi:hypothetical protein
MKNPPLIAARTLLAGILAAAALAPATAQTTYQVPSLSDFSGPLPA